MYVTSVWPLWYRTGHRFTSVKILQSQLDTDCGMWLYRVVSGAFKIKSCKTAPVSFAMSVCPHETIREPIGGFWWHLNCWFLQKINSSFVSGTCNELLTWRRANVSAHMTGRGISSFNYIGNPLWWRHWPVRPPARKSLTACNSDATSSIMANTWELCGVCIPVTSFCHHFYLTQLLSSLVLRLFYFVLSVAVVFCWNDFVQLSCDVMDMIRM